MLSSVDNVPFDFSFADIRQYGNALIKKVYDSILNQLLINNSKVEYKECNSYYYLNVLYSDNRFLDNNIIVDIPLFEENLNTAKIVVWNGPLGVYEFNKYKIGTDKLLKYIVENRGFIYE